MTSNDTWSPAAQPQVPPQLTGSDPQPRRKRWAARHKVWTALLAVLAVVGIGVSLATAVGASGKTSSLSATRYANAASLVAAMNAHGARCTDVSYTGSDLASCQGGTMALTFSSTKATHGRLMSTAHDMIALAGTTGKTMGAVVGPNWIVIGTPASARRVQHGLRGQYLGPDASSASTRAAPSPSSSLAGPVGTVYTVTDPSGNKMSVTLTKVIDPAQGADQFTTPDNGNRFVGAVFTITGISGTFSDDANNDATLIGSNGQTYTADFDSIAGYTNFNNGTYNVSAGENSVGAVTFQLPLSVKIAKIEWSADSGLGGAPAEWQVPATASAATTGTGPWAVVQAYYSDITVRDYPAAWRLLGNQVQGQGYSSFVAGYANTGRQTVTKISQPGDQVSFTLTSDNPDGTVQTYQGTDTVTGGKIVAANVTQTGGPAAA